MLEQSTSMLPTSQVNSNENVGVAQINKWFVLFCSLHLILWTFATTFFRSTIPFDTAEGFAWGNQWQWGYDKHPLLAPWLTALFANLGGGVGAATYLLSQLAVVIAFICIFYLAKKMMTPALAFISVLLLEGIDFYTIVSPKFDPDILTLATWALAILCFYNAIVKPNYSRWILVGITAALAVLSKYTSLLLLASMFMILISTQEGKTQWQKPYLYTSVIVFLLLIMPNVVWLFNHNFISITYAMNRGSHDAFKNLPFLNHIIHPLKFIIEESLRFIPVLLIAIPLYFCKRTSSSSQDKFNKKFLLIMTLSPFLLATVLSIILGTDLHAGWAFPFFTLATVTFVYFLRPLLTAKRFRQVIVIVAVVMIGFVSAHMLALNLEPYISHKTNKADYPMKNIALSVTELWHREYQTPLTYVAGSRYLTAFVTAYSPDHPKPYFSWSKKHSVWINENNLKQKGAIFVWWAGDLNKSQKKPILPENILRRFPKVTQLQIKEFTMLTKAKVAPLRIGIAILPPNRTKS